MVNEAWKSGVLLAILASFTFSIMNALVKEASATLPASEIGFFRGVIGSVLVYLLMLREKVSFSNQDVPMLLIRGLLGALYLVCYFFSIAHIPLADASILAHMSPVFIILISAVFLRERVATPIWLLLGVVIIGAALIVRPFSYSTYSMYAAIGLLGAFFAGGAHVAIRQLSARHHAYEIVFYFLSIAALVSIPLMWTDFVWPTSEREWICLITLGVVSLLGQLFLTKAFTHESAAIVAVTRYIGIVFNVAWGWLFWSESIGTLTIAGGCLIVAACILLSRLKGA
ncbi:DMT family transporter [Paraburkholderia edwinii]|uniref:DMT family transporter n=2 Tax=Paraburkholderia edwinii TaxID=2861782 RepID=A0ABX8UIH3_9BURK|nr:DMT family transporter [Paraburkholderia edwinii]